MLVGVASVLDQVALCFLEALRFALAGFDQRAVRLIRSLLVDRIRVGTRLPADSARLCGGLVCLASRSVVPCHSSPGTPHSCAQTIDQ